MVYSVTFQITQIDVLRLPD